MKIPTRWPGDLLCTGEEDGRWQFRSTIHSDGDFTVKPPYQPGDVVYVRETRPAWAARYWLKVEAVRVERLQAISEADAIAEGVDAWESCPPECVSKSHDRDGHRMRVDPRAAYAALWESNPWVWIIGFDRVEAPCA